MILARPEGGIGVSRTHSTSSTIPTDNAVQNLYLEVYSTRISHTGSPIAAHEINRQVHNEKGVTIGGEGLKLQHKMVGGGGFEPPASTV